MCVKRSGAEAIDPEARLNHSSQAFGREDGQLVDVSNVPLSLVVFMAGISYFRLWCTASE